jgi:hypothetical protein
MNGIAHDMSAVSKVEQKIWVLLDYTVTSFSATPTAAPAADQPTRLFALLVPPVLTSPAPYPPAHTSNTTTSTTPA